LISPTYITTNKLDCHKPPDYKVCAGDTMRSGFISKEDNWFNATLIYRLQRRLTHESGEISKDTSSTAHLLVVWRVTKSNELYADILLVEYDKGLIWNKNDLKDLHRKNIYLSRLHPSSTTEIWSLNDNVALMTIFEIMSEDRTVNIIISEVERSKSTRTPIHIDPKR
jgi:hypothetical protein